MDLSRRDRPPEDEKADHWYLIISMPVKDHTGAVISQTFQLLGEATQRHPACFRQALFENVEAHNQFPWVVHWQ